MQDHSWITPLLRGLAGLIALAVLGGFAWWQFVSNRSADEPFDSGVD